MKIIFKSEYLFPIIKINTNCPESEKIGGDYPCSGASKDDEIKEIKLDTKPLDLEHSEAFDTIYKKLQTRPIEYEDEDVMLKELVKDVNFDGLPTIISKDQIDKLVSKGNLELFRGVLNPSYVNEFKHGEYFAGQGEAGSGIYAAYGKEGIGGGIQAARQRAAGYGQNKSNTVMRLVLCDTAKIVESTQLKKEQHEFINNLLKNKDRSGSPEANIKNNKIGVMLDIVADPGRFALVKGYDAIKTTGKLEKNLGTFVILNRKALYIQDDNK